MTNPFSASGCAHEPEVVEAARLGHRPPAVEAHLATCADCRELDRVVASLSRLAADTDALAERRRLPNAAQIWWKAQLARRWEAEAQAVAPLDMMQRLEIGVGIAAAIVLLVAFVRSMTGGPAAPAAGLFPAVAGWLDGSYTGVIAIGVLLLAAGSVLALHRFMASE
jgi:predicted anti-sigma-YlaC factor YlaD